MVLRDPVERAHSNWTHLWSADLEPIGDVVQACADEERRIAEAGPSSGTTPRLNSSIVSAAGRSHRPVGAGEAAADIPPRPAVPYSRHPDHSPPDEVLQGAEGVFGHGMLEVAGPSAHDLIEPGQHEPSSCSS